MVSFIDIETPFYLPSAEFPEKRIPRSKHIILRTSYKSLKFPSNGFWGFFFLASHCYRVIMSKKTPDDVNFRAKIDEVYKNSKNMEVDQTDFSSQKKAMCHLAALGYNKSEIARNLGLNNSTVSVFLKATSVKKEIARIQTQFWSRDNKKLFQTMLPRAVTTVYNLMCSRKVKDQTRLDAAKTLLDRALGKPVQEIEHSGNLISQVLTELDKTQQATEIKSEVIEDAQIIESEDKKVDPETEDGRDKVDTWIDENLK